MKYRLWVEKVFPGIGVFSLDNEQVGELMIVLSAKGI